MGGLETVQVWVSLWQGSFCYRRVSIDGYCQALCAWFPTAFSHQKVRCLAAGPRHAWLWHALGDCHQTRAVSGLLSSPQMTHGNNMAAMHPKLLSQDVHGHFGQCLTCTSFGRQGSSLGAVNQIDQKIPDSSGAGTQHSRFHLDHRQPMSWCSVNSPCYWSKLSQDAICFIGK